MIRYMTRFHQLRFSELMEVYAEGNEENARELFPQLGPVQGILAAENDFYQYLVQSFFKTSGACYAVLTEGEHYISALRLEPYLDGFLLEALETRPGYRKRGYAKELISQVLADHENVRIYSHVSKWNTASMNTHFSCGFRRILDHAVYADGSVSHAAVTLLHE